MDDEYDHIIMSMYGTLCKYCVMRMFRSPITYKCIMLPYKVTSSLCESICMHMHFKIAINWISMLQIGICLSSIACIHTYIWDMQDRHT